MDFPSTNVAPNGVVIRMMAICIAVLVFVSGCSSSSDAATDVIDSPAEVEESVEAPEPTEVPAQAEAPEPTAEPEPIEVAEPAAVAAEFALRPSVNQLHVLDAEPGAQLQLIDEGGAVIAGGEVDDFGSFLWRDIPSGAYRVATLTDPLAFSLWVDVFDEDSHPDAAFYAEQTLETGYNYITTRDGTTLSATVWTPSGDGPFPTVVEYSGYGPSNPNAGEFAQIFTTLGFAYVGVNMRGTGCSGGSFEYFEPIQNLDGYDVIETIAAQDWVEHNAVGMVGISYPGISQLFVAQTQPPSLAAITPLSVIDDSHRSVLYPGGILNTGFALSWSDERESDSAAYGQGWEQGIVDAGDETCETNQQLRLQNTAANARILDSAFYEEDESAPLAPVTFVDQIEVPVFIAGAWQDEQTGGHFPAMIDDFTASPAVFATMVNGSHTESLSPEIFARYSQFLDIYVAKRTPSLTAAGIVATIMSATFTGVSTTFAPDTSYDGLDYEAALAQFEAQPRVRVLFEEGALDGESPGTPRPRYEAGWNSWPVPGEVTAWYFQTDGSMHSDKPVGDGEPSSYVSNPESVPATIYDGDTGSIWQADVVYDWNPIPDGTGVAWVTEPLATNTVIVGFGSADLWVRASEEDVDLEVTITEVRPDGQEVYVQSGWLRASQRALAASATELRPTHTQLEIDAAPLVDGEFALARVEIFPVAHAFRAGSSIRVTVDAPGGARPFWAFDFTYDDGATVEIANDAEHPSRLVLNVVDGVDVPSEAPPCGALRSQPCREYVPFSGN